MFSEVGCAIWCMLEREGLSDHGSDVYGHPFPSELCHVKASHYTLLYPRGRYFLGTNVYEQIESEGKRH